jgi:hypothetical protein
MYVDRQMVHENEGTRIRQCRYEATLATVSRDGCHVICSVIFLTRLKFAEFVLKSNMYQTGTVMKKKTEMAASKLEDDKGFGRVEWEETRSTGENLCILKW